MDTSVASSNPNKISSSSNGDSAWDPSSRKHNDHETDHASENNSSATTVNLTSHIITIITIIHQPLIYYQQQLETKFREKLTTVFHLWSSLLVTIDNYRSAILYQAEQLLVTIKGLRGWSFIQWYVSCLTGMIFLCLYVPAALLCWIGDVRRSIMNRIFCVEKFVELADQRPRSDSVPEWFQTRSSTPYSAYYSTTDDDASTEPLHSDDSVSYHIHVDSPTSSTSSLEGLNSSYSSRTNLASSTASDSSTPSMSSLSSVASMSSHDSTRQHEDVGTHSEQDGPRTDCGSTKFKNSDVLGRRTRVYEGHLESDYEDEEVAGLDLHEDLRVGLRHL